MFVKKKYLGVIMSLMLNFCVFIFYLQITASTFSAINGEVDLTIIIFEFIITFQMIILVSMSVIREEKDLKEDENLLMSSSFPVVYMSEYGVVFTAPVS